MTETAGKTAFVFAGGGSLGAIQVGMLRTLLSYGVRPDFVVGSSVGAINASYFAAAPDADGVAALARICAVVSPAHSEVLLHVAACGWAAAFFGFAEIGVGVSPTQFGVEFQIPMIHCVPQRFVQGHTDAHELRVVAMPNAPQVALQVRNEHRNERHVAPQAKLEFGLLPAFVQAPLR